MKPLNPQASYKSVIKNKYDTEPGLGRMRNDERIIELDDKFFKYHTAKNRARSNGMNSHVIVQAQYKPIEDAVANFIACQLIFDQPKHFDLERNISGFCLYSNITGDEITYSNRNGLTNFRSGNAKFTQPINSLDALAMQMQDDLAVMMIEEDDNAMRAVHVCLPFKWNPADKIGKSYKEIHEPVPMNKDNGHKMMKGLSQHGPRPRFNVGFTPSPDLNQNSVYEKTKNQPPYSAENFYLRIERQITAPLPNENAMLFFIRTYTYGLDELTTEEKAKIVANIESMNPAQLEYKGLSAQKQKVLEILSN